MSRLRALWSTLRDGLWFVPALMTLGGAALSVATISLDGAVLRDRAAIEDVEWLFVTGAEGARGVLGVIASSLITVTGVVFSVTIVALQLASTQFTPRVLRNFMSDRGNQVVLGTFIATFTYTLLILRTVQDSRGEVDAFVPSVSVATAVLLALGSIAALIYYIDHIARSIQVSTILRRVTEETQAVIDRVFPHEIDGSARVEEPHLELEHPGGDALAVCARQSGYLQAIDSGKLSEESGRAGLVIRVEREIGDFVLEGELLATVRVRDTEHERVREMVRDTFVLGVERTPDQDVERGILELVDIAVKALSTSINDPTTATMCIDRIAEVLATLGRRDVRSSVRCGRDGELIFPARRESFARAVRLGFTQIRHFGADQPEIVLRGIENLGRTIALVPESQRAALREEIRVLSDDASGRIEDERALERIAAATREALARN